MQRVAIVRFPGSNCDHDSLKAAHDAGLDSYYVWHRETDLKQADAVVIPGGFSYGDYLRSGAIARFSPVMSSVQQFALKGGPVLGICNGFQILCEASLLPGALMRNAGLAFLSRPVDVRIERTDTPFTSRYHVGQVIRLPVASGDGRFTAAKETLAELESEHRVVLRYVNAGAIDAEPNPNGSSREIAGICNPARNVVGIMPHPERAADLRTGSTAGADFLRSLAAPAAASAA